MTSIIIVYIIFYNNGKKFCLITNKKIDKKI